MRLKTIIIILVLPLLTMITEDLNGKVPFEIGDYLPDSIHLDDNRPKCEKLGFYLNPETVYPTVINGTEYYFATAKGCEPPFKDKPRIITMIIVEDSSFITPEGLKTGQSFSKALQFSKGVFIDMRDYANKAYVKLPSGWNASFRANDNNKSLDSSDEIPPQDRKIEYFFKMNYPYEYEKVEDYYKTIIESY